MAIDLSNYEDVATLNKWFQPNYPTGSLQILDKDLKLILNKDGQLVDELFIVTTGVFRDVNDLHPAVMNLARGLKSEYPKHMQRFYAEDVTTSSYGRCLTLLKASDKTATRDDMTKVVKLTAVPDPTATYSVDNKLDDPATWPTSDWADAIVAPKKPADCCDAGMTLRKGISKTTKKPYMGWVCLGQNKEHAIWAKISATGAWYFPDDAEQGKGGE